MSLSITNQYIELQELINKSHNTQLVNVEKSPNENTIYHIYSDGEITYQKGSWAYLNRSEFSEKSSLSNNFTQLEFPKKTYNYGYAIVTLEDAIVIRDMMIKINNLYLIKNNN